MKLIDRYLKSYQPNDTSQYLSNPEYPTDKESWHSYISGYYSDAFDDFDCKNLLEIGIYEGGSIKLWRDHFPNAQIYGIDTDIERSKNYLSNLDRITIQQMNAYSEDAIKYFGDKKFDIIIDDGPHTLNSLKYTAKNYSNLISNNGLLILEDLQEMSWVFSIAKELPAGFKHETKDLRSKKNRYDDILMIISKI